MNERIRELCSQAISDVDGIQNPDTQHMYIPDCFRDRFAELLVKECVELVSVNRDLAIEDGWNVDEAMSTAINDIEEHFGVEE